MESIKDILDRLCLVYGVSNNRQLSKEIDINYNTISTWIKRESIPYEKLHKIVQKESISYDWLLTGKGIMRHEFTISEPTSTNETYQVKKLTCKASAGAGNDITDIDLFDSGEALHFDTAFFKVPPNKTVRAIQVDGYSMIPMLFPDSWVLFETGDRWVGDGLYVLNFRGELMVKLLQLEPNGTLHIISTNKDYQSWETNPKEDQSLYYIIGKVLRSVI